MIYTILALALATVGAFLYRSMTKCAFLERDKEDLEKQLVKIQEKHARDLGDAQDRATMAGVHLTEANRHCDYIRQELSRFVDKHNAQFKPGEVRYMLRGDGSVEKQRWDYDSLYEFGTRVWVPCNVLSKKEADAEIEALKKEAKRAELLATIPPKQYWPVQE